MGESIGRARVRRNIHRVSSVLPRERERFKQMMVIHVESRGGEPLSTPLSACFGDEGGDIGRGADCTLVLPDPERSISRKHLRVARQDGLFLLRLISSNLLVELNGVPLAPGVEYPIASGADIRIGPFVLRTREEEDEAEPAQEDGGVDLLLPDRRRQPRNVFHHVLSGEEPPAPAPAPESVDLAVEEAAIDADALLAALQAGLALKPAPARSPEQMRIIGAALRALVGGTLALLDSRNLAKRALGAGQTMSLRRQNNPLKASRDVDAALARLLGSQQPGFLAPVAAVDAAFDDLRAHELAMLAGMRAAIQALLARLAPAELESRLLSKGGVWDNLMPVNRKAKLWERYEEQHSEIVAELENDFDLLFGEAFAQAYEAQLEQLGRSAPPRP